jgi:DNA-binding CsgD family transcriptional regulator
MMHPNQIAIALDDRFRLLTGGRRTALPRQQTLEASVAWSHDLLDEAERALARRLSVLRGFTLDAAEAVGCEDDADRFGVLDVLGRLVDKSVIQVELDRTDTRYRILESVRQFLQTRLVEAGEAETVRARHFHHFLGMAEALAPLLALRDGPHCLALLEDDHDNLDAALEWGFGAGLHAELLRFTTALTLFWELRGHLAKGGRWFARVLGADEASPSIERARALWGAAHVALYGDDFQTMLERAPEALGMAEAVGDDWAAARAFNTLGLGELLFDPEAGRARLTRSIELGEAIGDDWAVADGWKMMAVSYYIAHDDTGASGALEELRRAAERLHSGFFLAWYHSEVGYFAAHRGNYAAAQNSFEQGAEWARVVGDPSTGGFTEAWSLDARAATGDRNGAAAALEALIARANASGSGLAIAEAATSLADIALAMDDGTTAIALLEPIIEATREAGVPVWIGQLLRAQGSAKRAIGDADGASAALDEARTLVAPVGNDWLLAQIDYESALLARDLGHAGSAEDLLHAALARQVRHDLRPGIVATLEALGTVALDAESSAEAVRCLAGAHALRAAIGLAHRPVDETQLAARLELARSVLGRQAFQEEWDAATALSLAELIEYVSRARGERKRPSAGWASLTPTELRIVDLVAAGLTNPQIAERMFIARGTVKVHLGHIFAKLGVSTRAELAAQATRRGITTA